MNLSRVKVWGTEILYTSDLNAEFNNIINNEINNDDMKAGTRGTIFGIPDNGSSLLLCYGLAFILKMLS